MTDDHTPGAAEQPADDPDRLKQRFRYERPDSQSVGLAVVQAVASVADVDALSLQPRLYDVIDPDALERLMDSGTPDNMVEVSFELGHYIVTVANDKTLIVQSSDPE